MRIRVHTSKDFFQPASNVYFPQMYHEMKSTYRFMLVSPAILELVFTHNSRVCVAEYRWTSPTA